MTDASYLLFTDGACRGNPGIGGAGAVLMDGRGEVLARLKTGGAHEPVLRLGRDFQLDGDLAERLAQIDGVHNVSLSARRGASHLRLVA